MCFRYTTNTINQDRPLPKKWPERKARDSNPHSPKGNRVSSAARQTVSGYLPSESIRNPVDHRGVEPRFPGCKPGVFPLDKQPRFVANSGLLSRRVSSSRSSTGGSRTHRHQALSLIAMPIRVPCQSVSSIFLTLICGPGSRTTASELMKLGRAPARPHVPGPGIEPGKSAL